jgi:hypothetical protein
MKPSSPNLGALPSIPADTGPSEADACREKQVVRRMGEHLVLFSGFPLQV